MPAEKESRFKGGVSYYILMKECKAKHFFSSELRALMNRSQ